MGRNSGRNLQVHLGADGRRNTYSQHDDRDNRGGGGYSGSKHVSFGDHRGRGTGRGRGGPTVFKRLGGRGGPNWRGGGGSGANLRHIVLDDGDESMGNQQQHYQGGQAGRARPHFRGGKKPLRGGRISVGGRGGFISNNIVLRRAGGTAPPSKRWHKVILLRGANYAKEDILLPLLNATPVRFAPINYTKQGNNTSFFVETTEMADALKKMEQVVTLSDGSRLSLRVEDTRPPQPLITDEGVEKIKAVMSARYTASSKALDLKSFASDQGFLGEPIYAPLNRREVMERVVKIIGENIPEIEAIDLSSNSFSVLDGLTGLAAKAPNVRILYLGQNNLCDLKELEKCKSWRLVDLQLTGNAIIHKYKDTTQYQGFVRKIFPSLQFLDGATLPKLITFDDEDDVAKSLPATIPMPVVNSPSVNLVVQFLKEYFNGYDADSREPLAAAYHQNAVLSLSCEYPPCSSTHGTGKLSEYMLESRNLLKVYDSLRRNKLLRQGRLAITSFLISLPKTQHDMNSLTLDVPFATDRIMTFTVTGIYKERKLNQTINMPIRHFSRMFVVVPQNNGFCIVNETIFITTPTQFQMENAFQAPPPPAAVPAPSLPDEATMRAILAQLSQRTGMNEHWTKECLDQSGWDLEKAFVAFTTAQQENKIPPAAFEK